MKKITYLILLCCLGYIHNSIGQETTTPAISTIDKQFNDLLKKSSNYEEYKVVKKAGLNTLQNNTRNHINQLQSEISNLETSIQTQQTEVDKLNNDLTAVQEKLSTTTQEKDTMSFFGMRMSKASFQTLFWCIIAILFIGLLFFIFKFKNSNAITREVNNKFSELESEFEEYRRKAIEKEQKMGRQLLDERNKLIKATKS